MKTKLLYLLLFTSSIVFSQSAWRPMGPDDIGQFSYYPGTNATLDNNNVPYCSLNEPTMANKITVKKYNGTNWETVGAPGFTPGSGGMMEIEFDSNNVPYLAYGDGANGNKLTVYKFNGTAWELVGAAGFSQGSIDNISLDFNSSNVPYVGFSDYSLSANGKIVVRRFNGTSWPVVGIAGLSPDYPRSCCLKINAADVPYIAFQNSTDIAVKQYNGFSWVDVGASALTGSVAFTSDIMEFGSDNFLYLVRAQPFSVVKFDGTNWVTVGPSPISAAAGDQHLNLALDNTNTPYVSYYNSNSGSVRKLNGGIWETVGNGFLPGYNPKLQVDTNNIPYLGCYSTGYESLFYKFNGLSWELLGTSGISVDKENYTSVAVNTNNIPHIAYQDLALGGKATVKKYNGTLWTSLGSLGFTPGQAEYTSIKTKNNVAYLAYKDLASSGKASVQKFNGTSWEYVGVQGFSDGEVFNTAIAFGGSNAPYVVYKDVANGNKITVKTFNGTSWITVGSAGFSAGEVFDTSIAVTSSNTIYVAYKDVANANKITVQGFNGTSWQVLGTAGFSNGEVNYTKITVDTGDIPQVVYQDVSYTNKAIVKRFNGVIWENIGSATGISAGRADFTDISTDANNLPYIIYRDASSRYRATVQKFNGTTWEIIGTTTGLSANQADYCAIVLDNNNIPVVAYKSQQAFAKYFGPLNALVLAVDENTIQENKISIYPNPIKNTFSISGSETVEQVTIFDLLGKQVYDLKNVSEDINIEFLPKGFYIAKVKTAAVTTSLKISKE